MEIIPAIKKIENCLQREIVAVKGEDTLSYATKKPFTVIIDDETFNNTYRLCFKAIDNIVYIYITYITPNHYKKFNLDSINDIDVEV